jgi:hypothetical protein
MSLEAKLSVSLDKGRIKYSLQLPHGKGKKIFWNDQLLFIEIAHFLSRERSRLAPKQQAEFMKKSQNLPTDQSQDAPQTPPASTSRLWTPGHGSIATPKAFRPLRRPPDDSRG